MTKEEIKHLEWVYGRMRFVHKENENYDYMIRFREILEALNKPVEVDRYEEYSKGYHDGANAASDDINS